MAVCSQLPPRQRAAVVLRFCENLDYPEIAAILDCTATTALTSTAGSPHCERNSSGRRPIPTTDKYDEHELERRALFDPAACSRTDDTGHWVTIGVNGKLDSAQPSTRWDVVNFECGWIETPNPLYPLSRDVVQTWATGITLAHVAGPLDADGNDLSGLFRGYLG